ncbi:hypothetical protein BGZ97_006324 [Linnemannia gamsii]|uniref:Uncharacterized protein n=1 Tax=Linnemannia gamsii TaxID=64522 RepID=A0A9P6RC08_9FUNG|nr:hypothetical protein BGZ97_006324 [Linnemannia gamsii]
MTEAILITGIRHILVSYRRIDSNGLITLPRTLVPCQERSTRWWHINTRIGWEACTTSRDTHTLTIDIFHAIIGSLIHKHVYGQELKGVQVEPRTTLKGQYRQGMLPTLGTHLFDRHNTTIHIALTRAIYRKS